MKRTPKHKHVWRYHSSQFNEPVADWQAAYGTISWAAERERAIYGFTNVTYVCSDEDCTAMDIVEHVGRVSDPHAGQAYIPERVEKKVSDEALKKKT